MLRWIKYMLWLGVGLWLMWFVFNRLPLADLLVKLKEARYGLIVPVFGVTLFGYYARVRRWQLLLQHVNHPISFTSGWMSLSAGYLVSLAIPRGGEISRCLIVKDKHQVPFHHALASIIVERAADTFCLMLLITTIVVLNIQNMSQFFWLQVIHPVQGKFTQYWSYLLPGVLLVIIIGIWFWKKKQHTHAGIVGQFLQALRNFLAIEQKGLFLFYTLIIWSCYFLMTYIWVFAFDESMGLNIAQVFVIMVVGTVGKSVPIQGGGMGAYHFLVAKAFGVFAVSFLTANALAVIIHGAQTLYTILTGSIAYVWLLFHQKNRHL
ncbi:MAG: lysylphosphatidylglycerol synthase transmembrane domain-containing protein [Bacteroidota bacterium]|jgi:uncharacterized protein (TIRG00374 family)